MVAACTISSTSAQGLLLKKSLSNGPVGQQDSTHLMECTPIAAYGKEVSTFATRSNLLKSQQPGPYTGQQQGN
jgi:hypothetical protein